MRRCRAVDEEGATKKNATNMERDERCDLERATKRRCCVSLLFLFSFFFFFFFGVPLLFVFSSFAREKKGNEKGSEESSPIGPPWVARFGPSWCASFFFPIHQPSAFPRGLLGFSYRVFHGFTGYCDVATETASRWGGSDASPWFTGHLSDSAWLAMRDRSHLNQLALQWKKKEFDSNGNQQIMGP